MCSFTQVSLPYAEEWAARSSRSPRTLQAVLQQLADGAAAELVSGVGGHSDHTVNMYCAIPHT